MEPDSVEPVFRGEIFSVERQTWPEVDHPYDVIRHPGAAAVLPVTPEGDVVLVEQFRPAIRQVLLEIPAGLLDRRGEDPIDCAARELLEETGYGHQAIEHLGGIYTTAGFSDEYVHLFPAVTDPEPTAEPEEGISLLRRPLEEMVRAAKAGQVPDAKTALALLLVGARRSGA